LNDFNFYGKSKVKQRAAMLKHNIVIEKLLTYDNDKLENGYKHIVKSLKSFNNLISFFKDGGIDPWDENNKKNFIVLTPVEQYMVQKKKRLFKGIDNYDDVHRLVFDIETTGLNPKTDSIIMIGMKDNRGYYELLDVYNEYGEAGCIYDFFQRIKELKPTIISGYNSANFDLPFILERAKILKLNVKELTSIIANIPVKIRESQLKLGGEVEMYNQHVFWGFNTIDIAHSVRRAQAINSDIKKWGLKYITKYLEKEKPNRVYVNGNEISKIYLSGDDNYFNEKTGGYRKVGSPGTENIMDKYPNVYKIIKGKEIVEKYLDDDLYETLLVDDSFSQSTFLISKLVPTKYEKVATMGTATLWKLIMLTWSYEHNLAIPSQGIKRKFTGGLSRLLSVGFSKNVVKLDFSSLYPSIQLVYDIFPDSDVTNALKSMLKYFRNIRIKYKNLSNLYKETDIIQSEMYDRKQLPIKIFINGFFGSISAPHIFNWGDIDKGEEITCIGRQSLRMMIMFYMKKGYKPLVLDTDGVNFESPNDVEERVYIGKGLNELVVKGKEYRGIEADTAEFNDIFMRNEMGLDIDYLSPVTINISRKNYIVKLIKKGKTKIKLTGNTIKSKSLPQYISEFFDEGLKYLLEDNGLEFLELYYKYIDNIYNKNIPLSKIANKSRVKQTVEQYKEHIKKVTKSGALMSRQAHMELVILNNLKPSLGDTIYYINNGTKKNDGDVKKVDAVKYTKKEKENYLIEHGHLPIIEKKIIINCYLIDEKDIIDNPDKTGDYNVAKYVTNFNERIEPLLVVFHPNIRNQILIDNPNNRPYFTKEQTKLVNGYPVDEKSQDKIEDILTLSDSEILFWNTVKKDPYLMYLEDSLKYVDEYWINLNRNLLKNNPIENGENEDEEIFDDNWLETPISALEML
jgi:DNA polymerase elongation subunit (family B)